MAITRGISLYSLQDSIYTGQIDLEGAVRFISEDLGATGIEILAEQTPVGRYPNPSDSDVAWWKDLMQKYGITPTCMDSFLDSMLYKNRILTKKEQVEQMEQDLRLAARLGFDNIRVLCPVRAEVVEASVPIAEYYGVKMGLEIHNPMHFEAPWAQRYFEMAERTGSKYVCVTPDFGIFKYRPNAIEARNAIKAGANKEIVQFVLDWATTHSKVFTEKSLIVRSGSNAVDSEEFSDESLVVQVQKMGGNPKDIEFALNASRLRYNDPELLRKYGKFICHFHAKCYEIDPDTLTETGIDFENPIRILKEMNWNGCLSTEFEGQHYYWTNDLMDTSYEYEQIRLHHKMLKKLLGV